VGEVGGLGALVGVGGVWPKRIEWRQGQPRPTRRRPPPPSMAVAYFVRNTLPTSYPMDDVHIACSSCLRHTIFTSHSLYPRQVPTSIGEKISVDMVKGMDVANGIDAVLMECASTSGPHRNAPHRCYACFQTCFPTPF
jgi:hypothetical protein